MSERQKGSGVRRQIVLSMTILAFVVICGSYVFYAIFLTYSPDSISEDLFPAPAEPTWMAVTMLAALVLATGVAVKLAQGILAPLNSVADTLRRVAEGDLSVRTTADDRSMGKATRHPQLLSGMLSQMEGLSRLARLFFIMLIIRHQHPTQGHIRRPPHYKNNMFTRSGLGKILPPSIFRYGVRFPYISRIRSLLTTDGMIKFLNFIPLIED